MNPGSVPEFLKESDPNPGDLEPVGLVPHHVSRASVSKWIQ